MVTGILGRGAASEAPRKGQSLASLAALPAAGAVTEKPHAYLIMPFENTAEDRSLDWVSTGLAYSLGEYFLAFGQQVMDAEERSVLLEGSGIPAGAPLALASALELGRKTMARTGGLRIDRLILGRFNLDNGDIVLAARVIDLRQEKARPWLQRSRPSSHSRSRASSHGSSTRPCWRTSRPPPTPPTPSPRRSGLRRCSGSQLRGCW